MCRRRCHTPRGTTGQSTCRRSPTLMPAGLAVRTSCNAPTSLRWAAVTYWDPWVDEFPLRLLLVLPEAVAAGACVPMGMRGLCLGAGLSAAAARPQTQMGVLPAAQRWQTACMRPQQHLLWRAPSFSRAALTSLAGLNLCDVPHRRTLRRQRRRRSGPGTLRSMCWMRVAGRRHGKTLPHRWRQPRWALMRQRTRRHGWHLPVAAASGTIKPPQYSRE